MRFSFAIVLSALAVGSALAGHNCKCQDDRGQYNELTAECCYQQGEIGQLLYYPGPNHQVSHYYSFGRSVTLRLKFSTNPSVPAPQT
ncbi:hypothetical protein JAAARDRAFT_247618 [Jaapia argillacea MUCL 33604]|uniref:Uncharacterized protein n=1 Tax=Jaapia argillacea MUCL 33604 TaxID=933084 RepID=A0A067QFX1_9AGAM|nr:hypothetical protein JAAARDRAFT_247618 [Jaapia argillacea MUCL 33604]